MANDHLQSTDEELVKRVLRGDERAREELWKRYLKFTERWASNSDWFGKGPDAEDAAALACERIMTRLDSYDPQIARFSTWARRVARNVFIDMLNRIPEYELKSDDEWEQLEGEEMQAPSPPVPVEVGTRIDLEKCLEELSHDDRVILILKHDHGYTYREVGRMVEKSEGAVRQQAARACRKLRECLERQEDDDALLEA